MVENGILSLVNLSKMAVDSLKKDDKGLVVIDEEPLGKEPTPAELVAKIQSSVSRLNELNKKIDAAINAGKLAVQTAKDANGVKATFSWYENKSKTQAVIQAMQNSDDKQSQAIEMLSEAQEAQFKFQEDITHILKGLFIMGCGSLVKNRMVVRELQARLNGASDSDIDKMVADELQGIINQLEQQRDLLERQEQLGKNQKEQDNRLGNVESIAKNNQLRLEEKNRIDVKQSKDIADAMGLARENRELLDKKDILDSEQSQAIAQNRECGQKRDERIAALERRVEQLETKSHSGGCLPLLISLFSLACAICALYMSIRH